jgi:hypothetical protein
MDDSPENAIEENVDLFVNRYRPLASNFGFVKGFLSAAVGHAAKTSDRTAICELLLDAAAALDRRERWRSRHSRPAPWMPIGGEPGAVALSAEEVSGTLSTMHEARPDAERAIVNTAALCAAFVMLGWHDHKVAASVLRAKADELRAIVSN